MIFQSTTRERIDSSIAVLDARQVGGVAVSWLPEHIIHARKVLTRLAALA